ncbi:uncharacterized protein LOC122259893 isoform X1 [Penaeus japonicus]|uniref:uncharacterized protein LOC122259893 isoform X1 n=2 Tax=Penaeus japonicus TaxID=27405 RepID=UPI001C71345E|nr:uncharacterized protein LOC122259893 isoform X1 [Penaeus japonicus]
MANDKSSSSSDSGNGNGNGSSFCRIFTKKRVFLVITLVALAFPYYWYWGLDFSPVRTLIRGGTAGAAGAASGPAAPCPLCPTSAISVDQRRAIAAELQDVQREIARLAGNEAMIDAKWALRLESLASQLDPRAALYKPRRAWDYSAWLPDTPRPNASLQQKHNVCDEVYFGKGYDWPLYQHGMEQEQCHDVPPFSSVMTVVFPARSWPSDLIGFLLVQVRKLYDIPMIVLVQKGGNTTVNVGNVTFIEMDDKLSDSENLNAAILHVTTPFVLLGQSLAHFNNQSSLERLVRVLEDLDHVQVAGGAARDTNGRWIHGCLQQHMANYHAKYTLGYYHSKYECMYCDDLLTPFATRTKLLQTIPFTAGLSGQAIYRDWFAKVRSAGHLSVTCPDVMFFLSGHVNMTAEDWLPMARQWALYSVQAFDGKEHVFSCKAVGISCKNPLKTIYSYLLPPCCVEEMEELIGYLINYAEENHLEHELHAGSVLGAVKMGRYLPWDFDTDIVVACYQFKVWMQIDTFLKTWKMKCQKRVSIPGVYMGIYCPNFFLEIICHKGINNSRAHLPEEYRDIPTKALYAGRWITVRSNPGLYCRNAMGLEVLRHAAHWRTLKTTKDAKARGGYSNPGTWNKCKSQSHHSCLDKFPGDGNLPFTQPFLRP